jgi:hypothetical protein
MKGDFSRDTFEAEKHFLRVLMQQGRVQLDADWNEQTSILLHYLQNLAADLIGPHGGPSKNCGFRIVRLADQTGDTVSYEDIDNISKDLKLDVGVIKDKLIKGDFVIGSGHYYVDGVLCENEHILFYMGQQGYPFPGSLEAENIKDKLEGGASLMIYLDVWERHMTCYEAPKETVPGIREVALGGPDTTTRSKLVWQVKVHEPEDNEDIKDCDFIDRIRIKYQPYDRGSLKALAQKSKKPDKNPCIIPPKAQYRGLENQLYRVEIHKSGNAGQATFKWSRENGSVIFPIKKGTISITEESMIANLSDLGIDDRYGLKIGNWVDFVDDDSILQNQAFPLLKVHDLDLNSKEVILVWETDDLGIVEKPFRQPFLRRWDQSATSRTKIEKDGSILIAESDDGKKPWLDLEQGIQIQFQKLKDKFENDKSINHYYRTGDYWLIPARIATGDIEWPREGEEPNACSPHGVYHHYAPLAIFLKTTDSGDKEVIKCRNCFAEQPRPIT